MKRQWLYNENGGILFESEEAIERAIKDGYVDTPAKIDSTVSNEPIIYEDLTVEDFKEKMTVKELKALAKHLGIPGMSRKSEDELANTLYDFYNMDEEDL